MPLPKHGERRANDRAYLCISIVGLKLLTFQKTITLQRYVLPHRFRFNPFPRGRRILYHNPPKKVNKEISAGRWDAREQKRRVIPFGNYGNNPRMTAGSSSIFIIAKSAEPTSLIDAPMCHTVLSTIRKRS